jgi:hypothetical protein
MDVSGASRSDQVGAWTAGNKGVETREGRTQYFTARTPSNIRDKISPDLVNTATKSTQPTKQRLGNSIKRLSLNTGKTAIKAGKTSLNVISFIGKKVANGIKDEANVWIKGDLHESAATISPKLKEIKSEESTEQSPAHKSEHGFAKKLGVAGGKLASRLSGVKTAGLTNPYIKSEGELTKEWGDISKKVNSRISETPKGFKPGEDITNSLKEMQKKFDQSNQSYTVSGGFSKHSDKASVILESRLPLTWAVGVAMSQPLTEKQLISDYNRSFTQVGQHIDVGSLPKDERYPAVVAHLTEDIRASRPDLTDEEVGKITRYILERGDETNTSMEAMGAVSLGFGNKDMLRVGNDNSPEISITKHIDVADGKVKLSMPSSWKILEDVIATKRVDAPHEFGKITATYTLEVSFDDILSGKADDFVGQIHVKKQ